MNKHRLIEFDSVEAAREPDMQIVLLEMAKEDGNLAAIEHALNVIFAANQANILVPENKFSKM